MNCHYNFCPCCGKPMNPPYGGFNYPVNPTTPFYPGWGITWGQNSTVASQTSSNTTGDVK